MIATTEVLQVPLKLLSTWIITNLHPNNFIVTPNLYKRETQPICEFTYVIRVYYRFILSVLNLNPLRLEIEFHKCTPVATPTL
jgi:hypothetical protein